MIKKLLAVDLGASSGRVMCGTYDGTSIRLTELHRFSNDPVSVNGTLYWDVLRLVHEIKQGLIRAKQEGPISSLGIDTWGVDFGLLDEMGNLLENPVHYRDKRTKGMLQKSEEFIGPDRFYEITGNQFMEINTVFQIMALREKRPELLQAADQLLMMPDLLGYFLTGVRVTEYSIASTSQLLDARQRKWSREVLQALGIPAHLLTDIVSTATRVGPLTADICEELEMDPLDVIAVAGHDTQCALAATPAREKDFIFLSSGTWSLLGTELEEPLINKKSADYNITNEGGAEGRISFLKNITGLWCIQECRRQWIREGEEYSFGELEQMAAEAEGFVSFIDTDAPQFAEPGNLPRRIREYCRETGQPVPETKGAIVRCINESLALKYRHAIDEIRDCTGKKYETIYIVGGGTQSRLLNQLTADICKLEVSAGPVEATVLGNLMLQLMASGEVKSLEEGRRLIAESQEIHVYKPAVIPEIEEVYQRYERIVK